MTYLSIYMYYNNGRRSENESKRGFIQIWTAFYIENVSPKQYIQMNGRIHTNPNGLDLPKAVKYTYTTYWLNLFWKQK